MKIIIGIIIFVALMGIALFTISYSLQNASKSMAGIQKCQRITGKGFFECGNMTKEEINQLKEK